MPFFIENFGLEDLTASEAQANVLMDYIAANGKPIYGYYGLPYLFLGFGDVDFYLKTGKCEEGGLEIVEMDTHSSGNCVWTARSTGLDITPKDAPPTGKLLVFNKTENGEGLLPIHLFNCDVLPCFLEDELITMQMTAFPLSIAYYADEEEYEAAQPENKNGEKVMAASGTLLATALLINHAPERLNAKDTDFSSDDLLVFRAKAEQLYCGEFEINGNKDTTLFIRCVAETAYGKLDFIHTYEQVPEALQKNMKAGAIISGVCILSGDVVINEYENGIVKDFEHNFKLLRQVLEKGSAERLRSVLAKDAQYISEATDLTQTGPDEIIKQLSYVYDSRKVYFAHPATIAEVEGEDPEYPVGTRCIALAADTKENCVAIVFLDVNTDGEISRVKISTDGRYHFRIDALPMLGKPTLKLETPDNVSESMLIRAKIHGIVDRSASVADIIDDIGNENELLQNATRMLEALRDDPTQDSEKAIKNSFGYLFAKAAERTINEARTDAKPSTPVASYKPQEAFAGEISTSCSANERETVVRAMQFGMQFYSDLKLHVENGNLPKEVFHDELTAALVLVQKLGILYAQERLL